MTTSEVKMLITALDILLKNGDTKGLQKVFDVVLKPEKEEKE